MKRCSAAQWRALGQYIRDTANTLTLRDWYLTLLDITPENEDTAASVKSIYGRRRAEIKLRRDWWQDDAETLRHHIVHELLHLHHEGMDTVLHGLKPTLGEAIFNPVYEAFRWQMEMATDAVADAIAPLLPLPVIPGEPEDTGPIPVTGEDEPDAAPIDATTGVAS